MFWLISYVVFKPKLLACKKPLSQATKRYVTPYTKQNEKNPNYNFDFYNYILQKSK